MKIAIIGWGSLIWDPGDLRYDTAFGWDIDGPLFPLEYARISNNGRLTLVIADDGTELQTLYTLSNDESLNIAISNLRQREGTGTQYIGYYDKKEKVLYPEDFKYKNNVILWAEGKMIDAVIWTNLPENWKDKTTDRIEYLQSLEGKKRDDAKQYIVNTPLQIKTDMRVLFTEAII